MSSVEKRNASIELDSRRDGLKDSIRYSRHFRSWCIQAQPIRCQTSKSTGRTNSNHGTYLRGVQEQLPQRKYATAPYERTGMLLLALLC